MHTCRNWLTTLGSMLLALTFTQAAFAADAPRERPNVLFIAVDDMRVELGCYGNAPVKSPNIDRLAQRGLLFERAYCQQALCNPSRASLLTGLRPDTLQVTDLPTHFRQHHPEVVTLPQLFKNNGYHARNVGKIFHNWRQDDYKGDPDSWSVPAVMHYASHGMDKAQVDGDLPPDTAGVARAENRDVPDEAYFDGRVANLAVEALQELKDEPFFLAVGFWKPHLPFNPPKKYWDMYDPSDISLPINPDAPRDVPAIAMHDGREMLRGFEGDVRDEQTRKLRHGYYAAISYVDAQIGKVLDELDRLRLREKTIVVFWSDHGFHLGEHDLWGKTSNFELDAHVPLIISLPEQKTAGEKTEALVELLDLYPTLAQLCDLPAPNNLEGMSLKPLLDGTATTVKPATYTQHPRPAYSRGKAPKIMGYSVRNNRYRYTEWRDFKTGKVTARELYDHVEDPRETINLAGNPKQAETVKTMATQLADVIHRPSAN